MNDVIYYYCYMGLPFCGTQHKPIHADAVEKLPDTAYLASKTKGLVSSNFKVCCMTKALFFKKDWPNPKGQIR